MSNNALEQTRPQATEKVLTPKLRFSEFRGEGEWKEKKIEDVVSLTLREVAKPNSSYLGLGVRSHGKGTFHKPAQDPEKSSMDRLYLVHRDDLIVSITFAWEGAIAIANEFDHGCYVSHRFPTYIFNPLASTPAFFRYVIIDKYFVYKLGLISPGGAGRNRVLSKSDFLKIAVLLPSLPEQQKIADCLFSLDELITAEAQKLDTFRAYKKGLMQQLFPSVGENLPKLRFPEFRDAREWEGSELGSKTLKVGSGITPNGGNKNYRKKGRPFIRSQNIGWGVLLLDDVAFIDDEIHATFASTEISELDVLLNITGASIGRSAVADSRIVGGNLNQHVCIIRLKALELNPMFLNQYLLSQYGQKQIDSFQAGGNRQGLNFAQVRSFSIPIPPKLEEQQKIAECLSSFDELIAAQTQKLELLKEHKKGLMQQLFPAASASDSSEL